MTSPTPIGRPEALADRLAAITTILAFEGISHAHSTMQAMAWWDEALSPSLGAEVVSAGWERTVEGPRSVAVDAVLAEWETKGLWCRPEGQPVLSPDMEASMELLDRGRSFCGVSPRTIHHAPADFTPWYRMVCGFARGMLIGDKLSVSSFMAARDISRMLQSDYVFLRDPWEAAGGPAGVQSKPPRAVESLLGDRLRNSAGHAMALWRQLPRDEGWARDDFQAAWLYCRHLVLIAAKQFPDFGEARFLAQVDKLRVRETLQPDGTTVAVFTDSGTFVGQAAWLQGTRQATWSGRDGAVMSAQVSDGELLSLMVDEDRRGKGIGTYIMRHALTRGCARAVPPPEGGERLWGQHGWAQDDGTWALHRMQWPTCKVNIDPLADYPMLPSGSV